jgi:hypothetical protein
VQKIITHIIGSLNDIQIIFYNWHPDKSGRDATFADLQSLFDSRQRRPGVLTPPRAATNGIIETLNRKKYFQIYILFLVIF